MNGLLHVDIPLLLQQHGYWIVALMVGLESMGVPMPGETTLIAAAIYASTTGELGIVPIVLAAFAGAVVGDSAGFWIGREIGFRLLLRYGRYVGLTERRLRVGQYLFWRHGGKVVFLARFVAVLRVTAGPLAGLNRMTWPRFLLFNASGGALWASGCGLAAFIAGDELQRLSGPIAVATSLVVLAAFAAGLVFFNRHGKRLADEAERKLPGPLLEHVAGRAARAGEGSVSDCAGYCRR